MKILFTDGGRQEFYLGILDPRPMYWVEYTMDGKTAGPDGTEWLQMTLSCVQPFCVEREVEAYGLVAVSADGTRLSIVLQDSRPSAATAAASALLFYRAGTPEAASVKDLPSESAWVAIDRSAPACLVFAGLADEAEVRDLREGGWRDAEVIAWAAFVPQAARIIEGFVVHDDYRNIHLVPGVVALLRGGVTPVGVTWNSGVAITNLDFELAAENYELFRADESRYDREKFLFPHDPQEHFQGLLGW